jgi:hypothetical protein
MSYDTFWITLFLIIYSLSFTLLNSEHTSYVVLVMGILR